MRDTTPEIDRVFRAMLLRRSSEERLRMGCSMHDAARALVVASVLERDGGASPVTLRRALFLRFYGQEFPPEARERVLRALGP